MSDTYTNIGYYVQTTSMPFTEDDDYIYDTLWNDDIRLGGTNAKIAFKAFIDVPFYEFSLWQHDQKQLDEWKEEFEELLDKHNIGYIPGTITLFFTNYYNGCDHPLSLLNIEPAPISKIKELDVEKYKTDESLEPTRKQWRISYMPAFTGPGVHEWRFKGTESELDTFVNENFSCACPSCYGHDFWDQPQSAEYFIEPINED